MKKYLKSLMGLKKPESADDKKMSVDKIDTDSDAMSDISGDSETHGSSFEIRHGGVVELDGLRDADEVKAEYFIQLLDFYGFSRNEEAKIQDYARAYEAFVYTGQPQFDEAFNPELEEVDMAQVEVFDEVSLLIDKVVIGWDLLKMNALHQRIKSENYADLFTNKVLRVLLLDKISDGCRISYRDEFKIPQIIDNMNNFLEKGENLTTSSCYALFHVLGVDLTDKEINSFLPKKYHDFSPVPRGKPLDRLKSSSSDGYPELAPKRKDSFGSTSEEASSVNSVTETEPPVNVFEL